jgi:hypothetical protein
MLQNCPKWWDHFKAAINFRLSLPKPRIPLAVLWPQRVMKEMRIHEFRLNRIACLNYSRVSLPLPKLYIAAQAAGRIVVRLVAMRLVFIQFEEVQFRLGHQGQFDG